MKKRAWNISSLLRKGVTRFVIAIFPTFTACDSATSAKHEVSSEQSITTTHYGDTLWIATTASSLAMTKTRFPTTPSLRADLSAWQSAREKCIVK